MVNFNFDIDKIIEEIKDKDNFEEGFKRYKRIKMFSIMVMIGGTLALLLFAIIFTVVFLKMCGM